MNLKLLDLPSREDIPHVSEASAEKVPEGGEVRRKSRSPRPPFPSALPLVPAISLPLPANTPTGPVKPTRVSDLSPLSSAKDPLLVLAPQDALPRPQEPARQPGAFDGPHRDSQPAHALRESLGGTPTSASAGTAVGGQRSNAYVLPGCVGFFLLVLGSSPYDETPTRVLMPTLPRLSSLAGLAWEPFETPVDSEANDYEQLECVPLFASRS